MPGIGCISDSNLRAFLLGELPERVGRSIASHLEICPDCEAEARRLDGLTDTVIDRLRREFDPGKCDVETMDDHAIPSKGPAVAGPCSPAGFEVFEELGRGGMSVVYRARQVYPSRVVAIKFLLAGVHADAERRARFLAEADAFARLRHPNVVRIHEVGEHGGLPFLALEFVEGVTLADRLGGAPLPPRQAAELAEQLARAVHAAHRAGVVHRDLKPANVLIAADGTPKVTDFGLAKQEESDLTATGAVLGTPSYMAPEQAEGRAREVGPPADVYALGTILYEMLTGRPPFRGATPLETLDQVRSRDPIAPGQLRAKLPRDLDTICLTCLRKEPSARYGSAEALADDLGRFLRDEPIRARRTGPIGVAGRWCRRNPAVAGLLGTVAALLIALAAGSSWTAWRFHAIAVAARLEATERLFDSKLIEARAKRSSGTIGQRFESLQLLTEAGQIVRRERWPEARMAPLRNEAIMALTRFDVRDSGRLGTYDGTVLSHRLSQDMTTEVLKIDATTFSVRKVADGREVGRVQGPSSDRWVPELLSRDGRFLAVWTRTKLKMAALRVWDLSRPGSGPTADIEGDIEFQCWSFTPDGRQFAFGRSGGTVAIHDPSDGRVIHFRPLGRKPEALEFHPRRPWLAITAENSVEIHDLDHPGEPIILPLPALGHGVWWHPREDIVAAAADDQRVHLWDVVARKEVMILEGFKDGGIQIAFNHAGDLLVTQEWFWVTRFWDLRTGRELLQAPDAYGLIFSADDRILGPLQVKVDGMTDIRTSEIADRSCFRELVRDRSHGSGTFVYCAFSPRLPILAAAMSDGFGLWDERTGTLLARQAWPQGVIMVGFEESGALLVHGLQGITRWPVREDPTSPGSWRIGPPRELVPPMSGEANSFATSIDGSVLARGEIPEAIVWHRDRPGEPVRLGPHSDVRHLRVSPDGKWVTTRSFRTESIKLWSADDGRLVMDFPPGVMSPSFSRDGRWLVTGGDHLRFWEVGTWKPERRPELEHDSDVGSPSLSPSGGLLAMAMGKSVRLIEAATGREVAQLEGPSRENLGVIAFNSDGTMLAATPDKRSMFVWDLRAIRRELAAIGLDWDLPPYPPAEDPQTGPLKIEIDPGSSGVKQPAEVAPSR